MIDQGAAVLDAPSKPFTAARLPAVGETTNNGIKN